MVLRPVGSRGIPKKWTSRLVRSPPAADLSIPDKKIAEWQSSV
jgi:hypothetical protein